MSVNGVEIARTNGPAALARNYENDRLSNVQRLGNILAASGYFSDVKDAAQAAVKVMAGEELGIAPIASVMGIHIIKGKVTLSANLIAAQVRRHGYDYRHGQFDAQGCTLQFFGKKGEALGESSFTEADAKTAGVYGEMYRKFPRNMYFSRAMSNGAKWYCPEVMSGLPFYTPEELGAKVDEEGNVIEAEHEPVFPPQPIDTGGHPAGTQAAANYVADRKIAEMKRAPVPEPRRVAEEPAAPKQAEQIPAEVTNMWAQMRDIKSTIAVFSGLKASLTELIGRDAAERMYYGVLGKQGFEHANQFKSSKPARAAARELLETIRAAQQGPVADDEDLPDFGPVPDAERQEAQ